MVGTVTELSDQDLSDQELLAIIRRAHVMLSDPTRWSGRHYAENAEGQWTPVGSKHARRFNLEGALVHAAGRDVRSALPVILAILHALAPEVLARMKATSTQPLTHAEALGLLELAMAHLSFRPVRKQSGTHLRAVLPDEVLPPSKKTSGS
jgi:hypothetical protein